MGKIKSTTKKVDTNKVNNALTRVIGVIGIILGVLVIFVLISKFVNTEILNNRHLKNSSFDEYKQEINNSRYTIVILTKTNCHYCLEYKPIVNKALDQFNMEAKELNVSLLENDNLKELHDNISVLKDLPLYDEEGKIIIPTPTTIIYQKGHEVGSVLGTLEYDEFIEFLIKNGVVDNENL